MPRLQVYLPDELHEAVKRRGLPASELLQAAVRAELERQDAFRHTDEYVEALVEEVGEPSTQEVARAEAVVRRIRDRTLDEIA